MATLNNNVIDRLSLVLALTFGCDATNHHHQKQIRRIHSKNNTVSILRTFKRFSARHLVHSVGVHSMQ